MILVAVFTNNVDDIWMIVLGDTIVLQQIVFLEEACGLQLLRMVDVVIASSNYRWNEQPMTKSYATILEHEKHR